MRIHPYTFLCSLASLRIVPRSALPFFVERIASIFLSFESVKVSEPCFKVGHRHRGGSPPRSPTRDRVDLLDRHALRIAAAALPSGLQR